MGFVRGEQAGSAPTPVNPPWMVEPVKVKRIGRGFMANRKPVAMGEVVVIDKFTAVGLVAMGRAEYVHKQID